LHDQIFIIYLISRLNAQTVKANNYVNKTCEALRNRLIKSSMFFNYISEKLFGEFQLNEYLNQDL